MAGCAIVTGAGGGIGAAIAVALAREGWHLVLTDRDAAGLDRTGAECAAAGGQADLLPADVTREEDVAAVVAHAAARPEGLRGFVAAAGIPGVVEAVTDYPAQAFRQVLEVNTVGTFLCLRHGLAAMRNGGGSFVAIGSTSSIRGRANLAGYVASKHAVLGLVRSAALEQVGTGLRVNAVLPGPTQTAMIDAIDDMAAQRLPGGRVERAVAAPMALPADIAGTVLFLLSPASRHLNGSAIVVDGGSTLA